MSQTASTPSPNRATISAFIVCCNEERNIRRCLESIKWCDEIIVVDSGSTDSTLQICREYTAKIFHRGWTGFVEQKRYALSLCTSDWILNLDADEEVSEELRLEIINSLVRSKQQDPTTGYFLSRVVFHLGKWWRKGGWYPEYSLRLCKRSETTWGGADPHEKAMVKGPTLRLKGELRHYTYADLSNQISALNRFSETAAKTMHAKGKKASLFNILGRPPLRFIKFFLIKRGFLEGFPGFVVACLEAYYVFLKYVKLWELEHRQR
jgi:glycosyltransferase involved in cell wall biosynthesis